MPGRWDATAEAYAATFARLCAGAVEPMLDAVAGSVPPPATLLDVGTGPGTAARAAAARGYRVSACDPEPSMLAWAQEHGGDIVYAPGGLPDLPYRDAEFDGVVANFVLNHVDRPRAAVHELVRAARRGGVVAVTIWPRMRTTLNGLWSGVVADAGALTPPGIALAPEEEFERSADGLRGLLTDGGLGEVSVRILEWEFAIRPEELWIAVENGVATIGAAYTAQDDATRGRMRDAYLARTADLTDEDGVLRFPTSGLLGSGIRSRG